MSWAHSDRIFYMFGDQRGSEVWSINPDGSDPQRHTANNKIVIYPTVSPDGKTIAFAATRNGPYEIWTMNVDGTALRNYPHVFGINIDYTPDGRNLVFLSNTGYAYRMPVAGGTPVPLTSEPCGGVAVSPDGKWVVCQWLPIDKPQRTALIPLSGGAPARFFDGLRPAGNKRYAWLPDSSGFAYIDSGSGRNIVLVRLDGRPPQQLTTFTDGFTLSFDFSRDGKQIVAGRLYSSSDAVLITPSRE